MTIIKQWQCRAPYFNSAMEEYFLTLPKWEGPVFILWQNERAVIIGRNQNLVREVNLAYCAANGITVSRRVSGGGAVYHDLGNICFSYIDLAQNGTEYARFIAPVVTALRRLGIDAVATGKNDIHVAGKKISGNAQYRFKDRILHHGTILYDVELNRLQAALNPDPLKLEAKGIASVISAVANLKDIAPQLTLDQLLDGIVSSFQEDSHQVRVLIQEEIEAINKITDMKYAREQWQRGADPEFSAEITKRFSGGTLNVRLNLDGMRIKRIVFSGDFMAVRDLDELEARFIGQELNPAIVRGILESVNVPDYFGKISVDELVDFIKL